MVKFSVLCLKFSVYKVCLYSSGCARFGLSAVLHIKQHGSCGGLICGFPLWVSLCVCCEQRTIVDLHPSMSHTMIRFTTRCIETCAYHEITQMWITCFFSPLLPLSGRWYFKIFKFKISRFSSCHGCQRKSYKNVMSFLYEEASLLYCRSRTCVLSIDIKYNNLGIKEHEL